MGVLYWDTVAPSLAVIRRKVVHSSSTVKGKFVPCATIPDLRILLTGAPLGSVPADYDPHVHCSGNGYGSQQSFMVQLFNGLARRNESGDEPLCSLFGCRTLGQSIHRISSAGLRTPCGRKVTLRIYTQTPFSQWRIPSLSATTRVKSLGRRDG